MALVLYDRVRETSTVLGTSDAVLLGAVSGYQSFAVVGNSNTCYYTIADSAGNWEVGLGTYSTTGPTLARTTVYASSNSNTKVTFPAGTKDVFLTYPAEKAVQLDSNGNVSALGNVTSGTWQGTAVTTTYGGTGLASYTAGDLPYYASGTALSKLGIGTAGYVLKSTGTAPTWDAVSNVAVTTFSAGTTGFTPSTATGGAVTLAGTLVASNGGTGQSSYTVGDILYASTTSALSKLADVATGSALISGGVGVIPSWGKIGLTTHVSGTLPIANGGTNSTATPTNGGVAYGTGTAYAFNAAGTSGQILQSNGAAAPTWVNLSTLGVSTISFGTTGLTPATATSGAVTVAGTLATTNGGTGLTSFTANGIAYASSTSALATGSALTFDGTNFSTTGNVTGKAFIPSASTVPTNGVFLPAANTVGVAANSSEVARFSATGVAVGGTAARGTTAGTAHLDLFNGTAPAGTLTNGISLYSASGDFSFMNSAGNGYKVGFRNVPPVGTKTTSYTLAVGDVGKYVQLGASGAITIPTSTFAEGDVISMFNNTASAATITCSAPTTYIAGTDSVKTSISLAARGVATVLFISSTVCVVSGNVS